MPLAKEGDPYIQGNGELLEADAFDSKSDSEIVESRKILPKLKTINPYKEVSIEKLPEPDFSHQTGISAIVGLRLMGVSETDIAEIVDTTLDRVQQVIASPAAQVTFEKIYKNIINNNSESVQGRIASYANDAIDTVSSLMTNSEIRDDVRLKAAQDILDRSGSAPDQFFGAGDEVGSADDELRIVIMDEDGSKEKVKVEIKKG